MEYVEKKKVVEAYQWKCTLTSAKEIQAAVAKTSSPADVQVAIDNGELSIIRIGVLGASLSPNDYLVIRDNKWTCMSESVFTENFEVAV